MKLSIWVALWIYLKGGNINKIEREKFDDLFPVKIFNSNS
jgi:hypothetical protein